LIAVAQLPASAHGIINHSKPCGKLKIPIAIKSAANLNTVQQSHIGHRGKRRKKAIELFDLCILRGRFVLAEQHFG
jgi:hypothetical protein